MLTPDNTTEKMYDGIYSRDLKKNTENIMNCLKVAHKRHTFVKSLN